MVFEARSGSKVEASRTLGLVSGFKYSLVLGRELRSWGYLKSLHNRELRSYPQVSKLILEYFLFSSLFGEDFYWKAQFLGAKMLVLGTVNRIGGFKYFFFHPDHG